MIKLKSKPTTFELSYVGLLYLNCFGDIMELWNCSATGERYGRRNGREWFKI